MQSLGHADLAQTPTGHWYAVFLGKRIVEGGLVPLGRETFLCEVSFQNGKPIFNPALVLSEPVETSTFTIDAGVEDR